MLFNRKYYITQLVTWYWHQTVSAARFLSY